MYKDMSFNVIEATYEKPTANIIHNNEKAESISYKIQFSSVTQLCPTLCDPMNCSTPGLPVHHQLTESTHNSCPFCQ